MKQKILLTLLFIGIFVLFPLLIGCLNLERSYPEKRYFILDVSRDEDISSPDTGTVLKVRRFRISSRYEGRGFVYRLAGLNYESDFYNEFFIPPASLLTDEIHQWMAGSGLFQYVVNPSSHLAPTHFLEGAVTALYGDYGVSTAPKAILEMQFFLLQETSADPKIIYQSKYRKEEPLKGNTPDALVKSWNKALGQILTEFETDLKENIHKIEP
jgi:cholesterol transport system auxiliary component